MADNVSFLIDLMKIGDETALVLGQYRREVGIGDTGNEQEIRTMYKRVKKK